MERLKKSWGLMKESWSVLKRTPSLMIFPVISGFVTLVLTASFFIPAYMATGGRDLEKINPAIGYPLLFLFYVVSYFVVIFFNTGLVSCAYDSLSGREPKVADGINLAVRRLPAIFGWALMAATVGLILNMISERLELVGRIIVALFGAAWNIATFLVIPVIVVESGSPIAAVKKSTGMLKKTWGDQLIGSGGISLACMLLAFAPLPLVLVAGMLGGPFALFAVAGVAVLYWLALSVVAAAMQGVYQTALYVYAETGAPPAEFSQDYISNAFAVRERRLGFLKS